MRSWLFVLSILTLGSIGIFRPITLQANDSQTAECCQCVCICPESTGPYPPEPPPSEEPFSEPASNPTTPNTPEPEPEDVPINLIISELMPDPEGSDADGEFIELFNAGEYEAALDGWMIIIGSKVFDLSGTTMPPNSYHYWSYAETNLYLSNSGKTVTLTDPSGQTADSVTYPTAKTGQAYARNLSGDWQWTLTPSLGMANTITAEQSEPETPPPAPDPIPTDTEIEESNSSEDADDHDPTEVTTESETEMVSTEPLTLTADIIINEFLPDPEGSDSAEWVELWNHGQTTIHLTDWILDDIEGGSKPFSLSEYHLEPGGFLLINKSKSGLALNNSGDKVRLLNPNEKTIDSVQYQEAPTGKSFARIDDEWHWSSELTPGQANIPELPQESGVSGSEETEGTTPDSSLQGGDEATSSAENFEEQPELIPLSELPDLEDGTLVTVEATVSLPLNLIGKTILMIEDTYDGAGAEARLYGKERPDLIAGQRIIIQGRINQTDEDWRLNVLTNGLSVSETIKPVEPAVISPSQLNQSMNGMTVSITGLVTAKNGRLIRLTDEGGEPRIIVRMLGKDPIPGKIGDQVEVIGVVRWKNNEVEIIVPERSGLIIRQIAPEEVEETKEKQALGLGLTLPQNNGTPNSSGWPLALAGAATAGMITMAWLNWRRRQTESNG